MKIDNQLHKEQSQPVPDKTKEQILVNLFNSTPVKPPGRKFKNPFGFLISGEMALQAMQLYSDQNTAPLLTEIERLKEENTFEIDFGGRLKAKIKVSGNKIEIEGAMNGWGNGIPLTDIKVIDWQPLPSNPENKEK